MPLTPLFGALCLLVALVLLGLPLLDWAERKWAALVEDRVGPERTSLAGASLAGLAQPFADLLKRLAKRDSAVGARDPLLYRVAPLLAVIPILMAFTVIPWGGRYHFGSASIQPVVSDLDGGILYVIVLCSLSAWAPALAGRAAGEDWPLLGALRAAAQSASLGVAWVVSLTPLLVLYGTLSLSEIGRAQDESMEAFGFLHRFGVGALPGALAALHLPAWGALLNPPAFLMFLGCSAAATGRAPFDLAHAGSELAGGAQARYAGLRLFLFQFAERAETLLLAALIVLLFAGGWALPYLRQQQIVAAIVPFYGEGVANGLCLMLHVAAFVAKLVCVLGLLAWIRAALPRYRPDRLMRLCWTLVLPLSLMNLFATAAIALALGEAP